MPVFALTLFAVLVGIGAVAIFWNHPAVRRWAVAAFAAVAVLTALAIWEGGLRTTALLVEAAGGAWNADAMAGAMAMRKIQAQNGVVLLVIVFFLAILSLRRPK